MLFISFTTTTCIYLLMQLLQFLLMYITISRVIILVSRFYISTNHRFLNIKSCKFWKTNLLEWLVSRLNNDCIELLWHFDFVGLLIDSLFHVMLTRFYTRNLRCKFIYLAIQSIVNTYIVCPSPLEDGKISWHTPMLPLAWQSKTINLTVIWPLILIVYIGYMYKSSFLCNEH